MSFTVLPFTAFRFGVSIHGEDDDDDDDDDGGGHDDWGFFWLLNVPATCECISGMDLHRQFYVLPH